MDGLLHHLYWNQITKKDASTLAKCRINNALKYSSIVFYFIANTAASGSVGATLFLNPIEESSNISARATITLWNVQLMGFAYF